MKLYVFLRREINTRAVNRTPNTPKPLDSFNVYVVVNESVLPTQTRSQYIHTYRYVCKCTHPVLSTLYRTHLNPYPPPPRQHHNSYLYNKGFLESVESTMLGESR